MNWNYAEVALGLRKLADKYEDLDRRTNALAPGDRDSFDLQGIAEEANDLMKEVNFVVGLWTRPQT